MAENTYQKFLKFNSNGDQISYIYACDIKYTQRGLIFIINVFYIIISIIDPRALDQIPIRRSIPRTRYI